MNTGESIMRNRSIHILALAALCTGLVLAGCGSERSGDIVIEGKSTDETQAQTQTAQQPVEQEKNEAITAGGPVLPEASAPTPAVRAEAKMKTAERRLYKRQANDMMLNQGYIAPGPVPGVIRHPSEPLDRENYAHFDSNPVKLVSEHPVSTFSIDVDTGSYANIRRILNEGRLPPQDAVRIEEMINYFSYDYKGPSSRRQPFRVTAEMAPAPWNRHKHLLQIGIKGYEVDKRHMPASNLVFLVDVSGSMRSANKLGLLKESLIMLSRQLTAKDRVSLVVYAGASGVVLTPTPGNHRRTIESALSRLRAGGSTNGGAGIRLAYSLARQAFIKGGINRVILATDGDFNVGTVNFEALTDLVEQQRKSGITLTTLGFGRGNYNDQLMEQLADKGNGNYAYIDTLNEARKVLVDEASSTLMTIAKDVKIQIEFNPRLVKEYRLIGYQNRMLRREDFNNDKVDAGEIGAGHTVTALYEVTLTGQKGAIDPLRYGSDVRKSKGKRSEIAFLRLRYKQPQANKSQLIEYPLPRRMIKKRIAQASANFRFAASVAAFGDLLRGGRYSDRFGYNDVLRLASRATGADAFGYRHEFLQLVRQARRIDHRAPEQVPVPMDGDSIILE